MGVVNFDKALAEDVGVSLRPKRIDIEVYQGDTFKFATVFKQPPAVEGQEGLPVDITGWVGKCEVRSLDNLTVEITATVTIVDANNEPAVDGSAGRILIDFGDTSLVDGGEYKYDVQMTDTGGNVRTFIGGKFIVVEDITE
jgi:hypothetical protein